MNVVEPIKNRELIRKIEIFLSKRSKRDLLLFVMGTNTGLRVSDILALDVKDVKDKDFVDIVEKKTGKHKRFPLNDKVKKLVKTFTQNREEEEPLFKTIYRNRMERTYAYRIVNNACKRFGVFDSIGTHTLRKTFGYHHYQRFKDIALLQKIFNHYSPMVTLRYIGIEQDEINNSYLQFIL